MTTNEDKKYNGWTNYETWVTKLWIDTDAQLEYYIERTQEIYPTVDHNDNTFTAIELTAMKLRDELKDTIEECNPLPKAGMYSDLLNAALSEINYYEIAMSIVEDAELEDED